MAEKLTVQEGDQVVYCGRTRLLNEQVVSYEEFYIPRNLVPEITEKDLQGSKFEYFRNHRIELFKTHQKIKPALPDEKLQKILHVSANQPILINESINYLSEEIKLEYSVVYYNPELYDFEINAYSN
ncbi:GntR family transcriptional regulator [Vibrio sp. JC009]|uniref:GntR family transcriptional regulator n=1 Tax=Vibrio sp. JC009 TaxID=2912314 RepID=UPI0023B0746C|nr:GntR family transcriptional regulator [Vibrio sp. JC009]WED24977.1 GntR family transcriptional regulator [Vibrio sp. JC009]